MTREDFITESGLLTKLGREQVRIMADNYEREGLLSIAAALLVVLETDRQNAENRADIDSLKERLDRIEAQDAPALDEFRVKVTPLGARLIGRRGVVAGHIDGPRSA